MMDEFFKQQLEEAIKTIRAWEGLGFFGRLFRKKPKPSGIDYRILLAWLDKVEK